MDFPEPGGPITSCAKGMACSQKAGLFLHEGVTGRGVESDDVVRAVWNDRK